MNNLSQPNFTIRSLGHCRFRSPLHLSDEMGDYTPNFIEDTERIVFPGRISTVNEYKEKNELIPSFEAAGPRESIFFNPTDVKAAIVTCGGLCPGLNDVIRGLVRGLTFQYGVTKIYGIPYGYKGLVERSMLELIPLTPDVVEDISNHGRDNPGFFQRPATGRGNGRFSG